MSTDLAEHQASKLIEPLVPAHPVFICPRVLRLDWTEEIDASFALYSK
jgi:hypothetical protein